MGTEGQNSIGWERKESANQRTLAIGFEKLVFYHQATAGDALIDLFALTLPTAIAAKGFVNPTATKLNSANLNFYRNNFKLTSSIRGDLWDFVSYTVSTNNRIVFESPLVALDGEIFRGEIDLSARTGLTVVEGRAVVASGELEVGQTDVTIPGGFTLNANPSTQVGALIVERNGLGLLRNQGNVAYFLGVKGQYQEVGSANVGTTIRFNTPGALIALEKETYKIYSLGLVAERPTQSVLAYLESIGGQVQSMLPYLAAACGVPASTFPSNPTSLDLLAFAARVSTLESKFVHSLVTVQGGNGHGSTNTCIRRFSTIVEQQGSDITYADSATLGASFVINRDGFYFFTYTDGNTGTINNHGFSRNSTQLSTAVGGITKADLLQMTANVSTDFSNVCAARFLTAGTIIRPHTQGGNNQVAPVLFSAVRTW